MNLKKEEEIIETEEDEKGTFHPIAPYRKPKIVVPYVPRPEKIPAMYQFLEGFVIGLEAMERFMRNTRKISKDWFGR